MASQRAAAAAVEEPVSSQPQDVATTYPDKKSILMYVTSLFQVLPQQVSIEAIQEVEMLPRPSKVTREEHFQLHHQMHYSQQITVSLAQGYERTPSSPKPRFKSYAYTQAAYMATSDPTRSPFPSQKVFSNAYSGSTFLPHYHLIKVLLRFTLNSDGYNRRPGGRRHSKGNPESSLMWKPQEQVVTEVIIEEGGKGLRRPHCTVEEDVQKEEREKYRRLLEQLKGVHGNSVPPATSTHHSSQRCRMDTLKTKGWGEEQSHGVRTTQFVPKQYRAAETRGPLCPMRSEKRCSKGRISDIEKTVGIRLENEGKERDKRTDDLLELTEDMEKEISNSLGHGPQDEILSSAFKLRITRGDIQTLRNFHWLSDEVINFYMNLFMERNKKQGYPVLHAFSTFFYPKLKSGGYQAVKRWTKGVNLFEQELILVPIHRKDENKTKRNVDLNLLEWTHYSMKPHENPQQLNGSDCGMFTCKGMALSGVTTAIGTSRMHLEAPEDKSFGGSLMGTEVNLDSYQTALEEVLSWLLSAEDTLKAQGEISKDVEEVKEQFHTHEGYMMDLTSHQGRVGNVLQLGSQLLRTGTLSEDEETEVQEQMNLLNSRWECLRVASMEKQSK
ncbi:Sentrin-specific protease 2 [Myotis brandtii]|uniref:Sentrin-specific protease 2 n=1 Tax=Myotis brandtii TaxID=109478 RepID=S7QD32_MYOBR|nr:Sentrin-specific protease 2 [Myotis brandtii]